MISTHHLCHFPFSFIALLSVAFLFVGTGCEDTVFDPFENDERYYTVYGFLDVLQTNHKIRVIPVTRQSAIVNKPSDPNGFLDAEVTTTESGSGTVTRWRYALEELENGTYAHIFRASFIVQPGRTYSLEVKRSDGQTAVAETTVPNITTATLLDFSPVRFSADSSELTQDVHLPGIASPWAMEAIYLWGGGTLNTRVFIPYGRPGEQSDDGGWNMVLQISDDQTDVRQDITNFINAGIISSDTPVTLTSMGLRVRIMDDKWDPPGGVFDTTELALPSTLSNVQNGYGFWGSVGLYTQEWNICELSGPLGYVPAEAGC